LVNQNVMAISTKSDSSKPCDFWFLVMVINATFNIISAIVGELLVGL
jgi:hypothetical protein